MRPYSPGDDIFKSSADSQFDTFSTNYNPIAANMAAGGGSWGANPAYMTPPYLSPYRPRYNGPQPASSWGQHPGFFRSAYTLSPFDVNPQNYGGRVQDQMDPYESAIGSRPADAAVSVAQKVVIPYAAAHYGFKYGYKPFAAVGSSLAGGVAEGLGQASTSWLTSGARAVGGFAAGSLGGFALAQAGVKAAETMLIQPYLTQRTNENNLRRDFSGVTFANGGNVTTGRGLSRTTANEVARQLTKAGIEDNTFTHQEYAQITDYAARAGLLDTVSNPKQIAGKMKDIMGQVKLVMTIANTSDFKEAIEQIAKLQSLGATGTTAKASLRTLGFASSIAGISTEKMMNTVGMQGSMTYGAAGLTPYAGMLASSQSYASAAAAYRSGLISPEAMARMGGTEGMAQSAVAGKLGLLQTPLALMMATNRYTKGGDPGSLVGTVSKFGGAIATNPLSELGNINMNGPAMLSKLSQDPNMLRDMIMKVANITPGAINKNGKVDSGAAYSILSQTFGNDKALELLNEEMARTDPRTAPTRIAGINAMDKDLRQGFLRQENLNYGNFNVFAQGASEFWKGAKEVGSGILYPLAEGGSVIGDFTQRALTKLSYGDLEKGNEYSGNAYKLKDLGWRQGLGYRSDLEDITKLANSGNSAAIDAINKKGDDRDAALRDLANSGAIDNSYKDEDERKKLSNQLDNGYITPNPDKKERTLSEMKKAEFSVKYQNALASGDHDALGELEKASPFKTHNREQLENVTEFVVDKYAKETAESSSYDYMDKGQKAAYVGDRVGHDLAIKEVNEAVKNGSIDFDTSKQWTAAIDMSDAAGTFMSAATLFKEAVETSTGKTVAPTPRKQDYHDNVKVRQTTAGKSGSAIAH